MNENIEKNVDRFAHAALKEWSKNVDVENINEENLFNLIELVRTRTNENNNRKISGEKLFKESLLPAQKELETHFLKIAKVIMNTVKKLTVRPAQEFAWAENIIHHSSLRVLSVRITNHDGSKDLTSEYLKNGEDLSKFNNSFIRVTFEHEKFRGSTASVIEHAKIPFSFLNADPMHIAHTVRKKTRNQAIIDNVKELKELSEKRKELEKKFTETQKSFESQLKAINTLEEQKTNKLPMKNKRQKKVTQQ